MTTPQRISLKITTRFPYYNVQLGTKSTIQPLNMSISKLFQNALDIEAGQFLFLEINYFKIFLSSE